jgi:hypothetical protein
MLAGGLCVYNMMGFEVREESSTEIFCAKISLFQGSESAP